MVNNNGTGNVNIDEQEAVIYIESLIHGVLLQIELECAKVLQREPKWFDFIEQVHYSLGVIGDHLAHNRELNQNQTASDVVLVLIETYKLKAHVKDTFKN